MRLILLFLLGFSSYNICAQENADLIVGKWLKTPNEDMIIEVYKTGQEYKGKIKWTKESDPKKPVGFVILDNLKYNTASKNWENGKIHKPDSGSTYNATAKIQADGTLEVRGYMGGMKFFGRKKYFKKVK
jgi:uncharacterized protein (DUF2147 family)